MSSISPYAACAMLDWALNGSNPPRPGRLAVALASNVPNFVFPAEVQDRSYTRAPVTFNAATAPAILRSDRPARSGASKCGTIAATFYFTTRFRKQ